MGLKYFRYIAGCTAIDILYLTRFYGEVPLQSPGFYQYTNWGTAWSQYSSQDKSEESSNYKLVRLYYAYSNLKYFAIVRIVDFAPLYEIRWIYFSFGYQDVMCDFARLWMCGWSMIDFCKLILRFDAWDLGFISMDFEKQAKENKRQEAWAELMIVGSMFVWAF